MTEILVLSGKGGTGKTSVVGSLAVLVPNKVLADCDVDAADLHLLLAPGIRETNEFRSGVKARVRGDDCTGCGTCGDLCRFDAISLAQGVAVVDPLSCEGCGVCAEFCPVKAIDLDDCMCGHWFISETRFGPMVHAELGIGEENSGKLVSLVKRKTRELAEEAGADWILVDGPPGIGCPVIASVSGADLVLAVTEPTLSGLHDLERLLDLVRHFSIPAVTCINKWDLNPEVTARIEEFCGKRGVMVAGRIPFDPGVVKSLVAGRPFAEYDDGPAVSAVRELWKEIAKTARESKGSKEAQKA